MQNAERQLYEAVKANNLKAVEKLIKRGVDIHFTNEEMLRLSSYWGHLEIVRLLLDNGADANAVAGNSSSLRDAACRNNGEVAALLLERGADARADNYYALRVAAFWGARDAVDAIASHIFRPEMWQRRKPAQVEKEALKIIRAIEGMTSETSQQTPIDSYLAERAVDLVKQRSAVAFHAARRAELKRRPLVPRPPQGPRPL